MKKAIIFDMDGLMIDSERVTYEGYVDVLKRTNRTMSKDFYVQLLGQTIEDTRTLFNDKYDDTFDYEQTVRDVQDYIEDVFQNGGIPLKKGLIELLDYLKDHHYKTVVATSSQKHRVIPILKQASLLDYFDAVICGDEVSKSKPYPEIFLTACQKLNVKPEEAFVLEDSEAGIEAAYNGGIDVICIPDMKYPDIKHQKMTYKILDSLTQVISLLKSL